MVSFTLNNRQVSVDADPRTPLLWAIRDHVGLTGTKYGCGAGLCGACTIHIDGAAQRSCRRPGWWKRCRSVATASQGRS
jgi:isoquinoline 1-oxidoreductase subunit alpha